MIAKDVTKPRRLLTLDEAADRLSLTPAKVIRLANRGHFRIIIIAGEQRVAEHVLDAYIDNVARPQVFG